MKIPKTFANISLLMANSTAKAVLNPKIANSLQKLLMKTATSVQEIRILAESAINFLQNPMVLKDMGFFT